MVANRLDQVGFAQTGVAVNKQGVIRRGGVHGHRLGRGLGKFIGLAGDEILKSELFIGIPGRLLFLIGGDLIVNAQPVADLVVSENLMKSVRQKVTVAAGQGIFVKFVGDFDGCDALRKVDGGGFQAAEPGLKRHIGDMVPAIVADEVPGLVKGFHVPIPFIFPDIAKKKDTPYTARAYGTLFVPFWGAFYPIILCYIL